MAKEFYYQRRQGEQVVGSSELADVLEGWLGERERWIFVAAHDDDIVVGAGLMVQLSKRHGIEAHAVVTSDGCVGYCREQDREDIVEIRKREALASFDLLGVPEERVHFLGFRDNAFLKGRRLAEAGDPAAIAGYTGLQNSYTSILRELRPTRVFVPTIADYHPDHKATNEEMLISLFHASGPIWPELGEPVEAVPFVYEYADYCDFPEKPQLKLILDSESLERKVAGLAAYRSQMQTSRALEAIRTCGPVEYFREIEFRLYKPSHYADLFPE